jgi:hypothetical protein
MALWRRPCLQVERPRLGSRVRAAATHCRWSDVGSATEGSTRPRDSIRIPDMGLWSYAALAAAAVVVVNVLAVALLARASAQDDVAERAR